jgi:transposase
LIGEFRYHKRGRPVKVTDDVRQCVVDLATSDGSLSAENLQQMVEQRTGVTLGQTTIRNILHGAQFFWDRKRSVRISPRLR